MYLLKIACLFIEQEEGAAECLEPFWSSVKKNKFACAETS